MKTPQISLALILVAAFSAGGAHAQTPLTREQVKAEFAEALRTGELMAPGESGLKLNELYTNRYPKVASGASKSRAEVVAELQEAIRSGDVIANGEVGLKENELYPQRYPTKTIATGKTRQQVRAETEEAIRTGNILAPGDLGLKLNEKFPQRYSNVQDDKSAHRAASAPATNSAAQ